MAYEMVLSGGVTFPAFDDEKPKSLSKDDKVAVVASEQYD